MVEIDELLNAFETFRDEMFKALVTTCILFYHPITLLADHSRFYFFFRLLEGVWG